MNKPCLHRALVAGSLLLTPVVPAHAFVGLPALPQPRSVAVPAAKPPLHLQHALVHHAVVHHVVRHETAQLAAWHRAAWRARLRDHLGFAHLTLPVKAVAAPQLPQARVTPTLPQYLRLDQIRALQAVSANDPLPVLQPVWEGQALRRPMRDLLTGPALDGGPVAPANPTGHAILLAQAFPRPLPPAPVPSRARPVAAAPIVPHWVRYPLEFQLCGIPLGTKVVDKDKFNRIDRYGLFALHGNPTAVVVPTGIAGGGGILVTQEPPEVAALFPSNSGAGLPDWASAITVTLDNNHVEWLYRRETYSMGFVVDRLGFVDAIVAAGISSNIAKTQLEDPLHSIKLGDDLRKVLFRYGYPDTLETYGVSIAAAGVAAAPTENGAGGAAPGAGAPPAGAPPAGAPPAGAAPGAAGAPGAPGAGAAAGGASSAIAGNAAFRTFEVRYEQSYNVVFTIRDNRVVRIYIFGDPDFFNARRRELLRTRY